MTLYEVGNVFSEEDKKRCYHLKKGKRMGYISAIGTEKRFVPRAYSCNTSLVFSSPFVWDQLVGAQIFIFKMLDARITNSIF